MRIIKVLIVEDKDVYVEIIKRAIRNREIIVSKTVNEALELLKQNEFNVIAIDNCFEEIVLSMTEEQRQKTIIYTRQADKLNTSAKIDLRMVIKNHIKTLDLDT